MSHSRVSLGPHCNSLHHERCGKGRLGEPRWGGASKGPRPACRARLFACFPARHLPTLASSGPATSLLLSQAPGGGKLEPLPSRGFQASLVQLLIHGAGVGGSHQWDLVLPEHHAVGHLVAPPCGVPGEPANRSAPLKPAPGWRPLLDLNRRRLPSFTFGFPETCVFTRLEATGDAQAVTCLAAKGN